MTPKAVVTDIEGTTSSIAFVHDVLFPYSRARLVDYVKAHPGEVAAILDQVRAEAGTALGTEDCIALLLEWHDDDRKIGPLKTLQGMIWAEGFAAGELQGHIYPDAVRGLRRWHGRGIPLYIYSSGSVGAQKLLFGHTEYGDLAALFAGFFDTAVGGKKEARSYRAIARTIGTAPQDILFLSDVEAELDAAAEAGFAVTMLARDSQAPSPGYPVTDTFDTILPEDAHA